MELCGEKSDAFVFDWRLEGFGEFDWYDLDTRARSPPFTVHALGNAKWYCEFDEGNLFSLCRSEEEDEDENEPDEVEVKWEASILSPDGSPASTGVRIYSFEKDDVDAFKFDLDIFDFEDEQGFFRLQCCLWGQRPQFSNHADDFMSSVLPGESDRSADDIPSETVVAMFPRYFCGVTRKKMERISACLDSRCLDLLTSAGELSTYVTSAAETNPPFYIRCSTAEASEFLKIEIRRRGKDAFFLSADIFLVNAENETMNGIKDTYEFSEEVHTLTCENFAKKSDLTSTQCPRSLQFTFRFRSDHVWIEKSILHSQDILEHPKVSCDDVTESQSPIILLLNFLRNMLPF